MIKSQGSPDKTTPGNVGDLYRDTKTGAVYECVDVIDPENKKQFVKFYDRRSGKTEYVWKDIMEIPISDATSMFADGRRLDLLPRCSFINCEAFNKAFQYASTLTSIPYIDTSNAITMTSMFNGCSSLITVPHMDTSNVTDMSYMFNGCSSLTTIPSIDTSSVTTFYSTFSGCSSITSIPNIDTSSATTTAYMFNGCTVLETIPIMNMTNVTTINNMFYNCPLLKEVEFQNMNSLTMAQNVFKDCSELTTIKGVNLEKLTANPLNILTNCVNLTNLEIFNIKKELTIGSGTTWGHMLTVDSLVHIIKELYTVSTTTTLTMGGQNISKISNLYCKVIDDADPKKPMELCESTEEGAITLTDYAMSKKWRIR